MILALCFRLVGAAVGFIANVTIPDYQNQGFTVLEQPNPFWDRFARWDSGWYYGIASSGYKYVEGGRSNLAFFPVYPQLMGVLGRAMGGAQQDFYFAGILISLAVVRRGDAAALPAGAFRPVARAGHPRDRLRRGVSVGVLFRRRL